MKHLFVLLALSCGFWINVSSSFAASAQVSDSIRFNDADYFLRWSKANQHEFTQAGQEDLNFWHDMLTINIYPQARDGEGVALVANKVLTAYKNAGGKIIKTNSVPKVPGRPAEHYIAAVLGNPGFLEFVQVRFAQVSGQGVAVIHSHRVYGKNAGPEMSSWMKRNGAALEGKLMQSDISKMTSTALK